MKAWSKRTIEISKLIAKEGGLVEHLRVREASAEEKLKALIEKKKDELLDVLRERGEWNEEQREKDRYTALIDAFARRHLEIGALILSWEKRYEDSEQDFSET